MHGRSCHRKVTRKSRHAVRVCSPVGAYRSQSCPSRVRITLYQRNKWQKTILPENYFILRGFCRRDDLLGLLKSGIARKAIQLCVPCLKEVAQGSVADARNVKKYIRSAEQEGYSALGSDREQTLWQSTDTKVSTLHSCEKEII